MATPRVLVPVIPVRIGAAQQRFLPKNHNTFCTRGRTVAKWKRPKTNPRGVMVAAMDSKSIPVLGCRFKSGRGYETSADLLTFFRVKSGMEVRGRKTAGGPGSNNIKAIQ